MFARFLVENCYECHGAKISESNLRLDSRPRILQGGDRGTAIEPGNAEQSLLVQAVTYADPELEMPPSGKLEASQIADLRQWIQQRAAWPVETDVTPQAEKRRSGKSLGIPADHLPGIANG